MKKWILAVLTALAIFGMYLASPVRREKNAPEVSAALPSQANVYDSVILRGTIVERARESVYATGAATVTEVYVKPGDAVTKGQPLLLLTPVRQKEEMAAAVYGDMSRELSRLDLDNMAGLDSQSQELAAVFSAAMADGLDQSGQDPQPYVLSSPIDGVVMEAPAQAGDKVSSLLPCAAVSDLTQLGLKSQVNESLVSQLAPGMYCSVTSEALSDKTFPGKVETVMPYAKQTGLLTQKSEVKTEVMVSLISTNGVLRPGYSAVAKVITERKEGALLVPYEAIAQDEEGKEYVMVAQDGRAVMKYVITDYELDDSIEVAAGLTVEDLVISDPTGLSHGDRVRMKDSQ